MNTPVLVRVPLLLSATLLTVAGALGSPAATLASCMPPSYAAHVQDANNVIVAGTILQVGPHQVTVDVQKWWGAGAARSVVIQRAPADPNVITSVDWNPQPGEAWIILAHREGVGIKTDVCGQWPGTAEMAAELQSAVGPGVAPSPEAEVAPEQPAQQGLGVLAVAFAGLAVLLAAVAVLVIARLRRSP